MLGQEVLGLFENSAQGFSSAEVRQNVQQGQGELVGRQLLPLEFAMVTDAGGKVVAAYSRSFADDDAPESAVSDPVGTWRSVDPLAEQGVSRMVPRTLVYRRAPGGLDRVELLEDGSLAREDAHSLLAGYPLPGGVGTVLLGLGRRAVQATVHASVTHSLVQLAGVVVLTALIAAFLASSIVRRLLALAGAADRISMGQFEQRVLVRGGDEIATLGQSVERLRDSLEDAMNRLSQR